MLKIYNKSLLVPLQNYYLQLNFGLLNSGSQKMQQLLKSPDVFVRFFTIFLPIV